MRSGVTRTFAACVVWLVLILSAKPCEVKPRVVQGLVTDEADAPLPDAVIQLDCRQKGKESRIASAKGRADGRFKIEVTLRGVCRINISRPGFSGVLIPISDSDRRAVIDLGPIRLRLRGNCSEPGAICDEVTPLKHTK